MGYLWFTECFAFGRWTSLLIRFGREALASWVTILKIEMAH